VNEVTILGRGGDERLFKQFAARYDVPAYVRRARRVQEAFDDLVARCRKQREEWLLMPRVYAKTVLGLFGTGADELRELGSMLEISCEAGVIMPVSKRRTRQAIRDLTESITRFDRRWQRYLHELNLDPINQLRDDYNRYYVLEKECALRSARLARIGFQLLRPVTADELLSLMPLLPCPQARG